jgi:hypothetical protein
MCGRRMKVLTPENRGKTSASTGSGRGVGNRFALVGDFFPCGLMGANYKASRP